MAALFALLLLWALPQPAPRATLESRYLAADAAVDADVQPDPRRAEWVSAPRVAIARDYLDRPVAGRHTEVRSRWTDRALYLLFICPYDALNLKPDPQTTVETARLWNWDVAEAFIGWDGEHIGRYKELQMSPQGEWVDLDIDRGDARGQQGMAWNSGYRVRSRIDATENVWYGVMQIPFAAIDPRAPEAGRALRVGLYRIAGVEPARTFYAWQPTGQTSFHVPQAFGTLKLVR